jgi:alpha-1,2-mannosyltransferase
VVCIAVIAAAVSWIATMIKARGDFLLHYEFGRRLRTGEFLYTNGMHLPYPPFWAMLFAPFSFLPVRVAMPLFFVVGFVALVALLVVLRNLTRDRFSLKEGDTFWLVTATLVLLSRFVLRDFADGGENLLIVALTWGGIYFFVKRKPLPGGALLGLAIALKLTPLLFAGYFVLKRQWVAALSTFAFATLFFISPALIQGRATFIDHLKFWKANVVAGMSHPDPSVGVLGPDELANKSLRPMLTRYLMKLPEGHPGRFPGAAHIDFLQLSPATAGLIIKAVTYVSFLVIMGLFCVGGADLDTTAFLRECAIINILMLLYSPITWGEHCVALIPALYLICLRYCAGKPVAPWINRAMAVVAFILIVVNRSIITKWPSELAESYHVITLCMIALAAVSLAFWNEERKITTAPEEALPSRS